MADRRPVRLVVTDDLVRTRVTVFFRLILAIPPIILLALWSVAALVAAIAAWVVLLVRGTLGEGLHGFLASYVAYNVRTTSYLHLVADPWPGLGNAPGYPVSVEIDPPAPQRRATVAVRILLAVPALLLATATGGSGGNTGFRARTASAATPGATGGVVAVLGWFASLARGRMPNGLRDLGAYGVGYSAQALAYVLLLTDRYPTSDPRIVFPTRLPDHPVRLEARDDLVRPRLLVFFRILLALPHIVWVTLWTVVVIPAAIAGWVAALAGARLPGGLHRFFSAYVRYTLHVGAFVYLVGGPFPGFAGARGSYPVDVTLPEPEQQNRWTIAFRVLLAVPAFLVSSAYGGVLFVVGVLGWFASLAQARMPDGLQTLGAVALRYQAQASAYALLLTERYPYAAPAPEDSPPAGEAESTEPTEDAPEDA